MQKIPLREVRFAVEIDFGSTVGLKKMLNKAVEPKLKELCLTEDHYVVVKGLQEETVLIPSVLCSKIVLCPQKETISSEEPLKKAQEPKSKREETKKPQKR